MTGPSRTALRPLVLLAVFVAWATLARAAFAQIPLSAPQAPPKVVAIEVRGEERYSEAQLISALGQRIGEPLDVQAVDRGIETLWRSLKVRADVFTREVPEGDPRLGDPPQPAVELLLEVVEMPSDREPRFVGNVDIDTKTLRRWALLEERVELFEFQTQRVRQRLLEGYRREGYHWVEVDVVQRRAEPDAQALGAPMTDLIFEIREGPKVRVKGVHVEGNRSMPDRGILFWKDGLTSFSKRKLDEPGLFNWRGSAFVQETLDADVLAMREVYRERGFLDAVVEVAKLDWSDDRASVEIHYVIDEGKPYTVRQVDIVHYVYARDADGRWILRPAGEADGAPRFAAAELLAKCELQPGKRYEVLTTKRDQATLRDFYGSQGFLSHASLAPDQRWEFLEPAEFFDPAAHEVVVTYRVVEGRPLTLREISFAGTHHTRDEVLRREVGVFPGGKADQKEIQRALSRIQGTGFFSDQFSPEDHQEPIYRFLQVPGRNDLIDLEFQVEEGRVVEFNIQGGVDSNDGAFGIVSLSMKNFDWADPPSKWTRTMTELLRKEALHGAGQRVDIEVSPGTRINRARLHFFEPDIFEMYLRPISLDIDLRRQTRIYRTHDEDRFQQAVKFGRRLDFDTSVSIGLVHTSLDVFDLDSNSTPAALQRQNQLGETEFTGLTLDFTTRDLDNLQNPHNGWRVGINNTLFTELLSSDFDYLRSDLQVDGYLSTGQKADGTEHVLHMEFDAGVMPTWGDTDEVPYTELFFTGGSSSLRGFALRGAGKRATDVLGGRTKYAAGGQTYMSGTLEWLYPLYSVTQPGTYRQIESLRGVLFADFGVLGEDAFELDLAETRASVGFGVGLAYPLPIQLNFGFPVRRFSGDERQTFSFSIGISF